MQKRKPFNKFRSNRPDGFHGYYAEVPPGGDPMRAYKRIKKKQKEDKFFEELKDRQYYRKPSEIKREKKEKSRLIVKRMTQEAEQWRTIGNLGRKR